MVQTELTSTRSHQPVTCHPITTLNAAIDHPDIMKISIQGTEYQNPGAVIDDRLPDLNIGPECVASSSLRGVFTGEISQWRDFNQSVINFYTSNLVKHAFRRCSEIPTALDVAAVRKKWKHFATLEHTQIAEERDLQGRFMNNVIDPVLATACTLREPGYGDSESLKNLISNDISAGSAKSVPVQDRLKTEPDIVFKIPATSSSQVSRIIGELKFPVTCKIQKALNAELNGPVSQQSKSARHILG